MSFTAITPIQPTGPYPAGGTVSAGSLKVTETVCDAVNGNSFVLTGHEVLVLHNTGGSAYTVTINSVADSKGRTADITTYSIPAGEIHAFHFRGGVEGWQQSDGTVHFTASNAAVKAFVLTFPN